MMNIDNCYFLPDHNLAYSDKMSMACGVEIRVPLIDNELTNYMEGIPDNYLWRWNQGKWILKKQWNSIFLMMSFTEKKLVLDCCYIHG